MNDFVDALLPVLPGFVPTITGVLIGYWLSLAGEHRRARRDHRKQLRAIRLRLDSTAYPGECKDAVELWWNTGVEDYGHVGRLMMGYLVRRVRTTPFTEAEFDLQIEGDGTHEQQKRYYSAHHQSMRMLRRRLGALIRLA